MLTAILLLLFSQLPDRFQVLCFFLPPCWLALLAAVWVDAMLLAGVAVAAETTTVDFPHPIIVHAYQRDPAAERTSFQTQSTNRPYRYAEGTDLVLVNPDGSERVLVNGLQPDKGLVAVHDSCVSLDGESVFYGHVYEGGDFCDLFRVNIATGETVRLTDAKNEYAPPSGYLRGKPHVWNTGPCEVGDGSIVFTSDRNGVQAPIDRFEAFQLFRMDADGRHVEKIGHLNLGGALHPTCGPDGRVYFASGESQGTRKRQWAIWSMNPDGTDWRPEVSAIPDREPFHFHDITTDGSLVWTHYYDARTYGKMVVSPAFQATPFGPPTPFGDPLFQNNPRIANGYNRNGTDTNSSQYGFQRRDSYALFPWATSADWESKRLLPDGTVKKLGMVSHPAATPNNGMLAVHTGTNGDVKMDLGIIYVPDVTKPVEDPKDLIRVVDRPDRHEWLPKAVVTFRDKYGIDRPPVPTGEVAEELPPGSPFAVIGTSSIAWNEIVTFRSNGSDQFIEFDPEDAEWVRVVAFNPTQHGRFGFHDTLAGGGGNPGSGAESYEGFHSAINERTGFFERLIPLKKWRTLDGQVHLGPNPPEGASRIMGLDDKPDYSFKAIIPADVPWTLCILNAKKEVIRGTFAQTWHQVRPGESRTNCNGCHAHHKPTPFQFADTFAASAEYPTPRLTTVFFPEFYRDIEPLVKEHNLTIGEVPVDGIIWNNRNRRDTLPDPPRPFGSSLTTLDDNPALSPEQQELVRAWIDTGMSAAGTWKADDSRVTPEQGVGPYADTVPPTLTVVRHDSKTIVGAFDAQARLNPETLSITASVTAAGRPAGAELADLFTTDAETHRWILDEAIVGEVTVSVRDRQVSRDSTGVVVSEEGNVTTLSRALGETVPPDEPEEPDDPRDAEIARLKAEVEVLKADVARLVGKNDALADQKRKAIEALEAVIQSLR